MRRRLGATLAVVAAAGCVTTPSDDDAATTSVRWLPGLRVQAAIDAGAPRERAPAVDEELDADPTAGCQRGRGPVLRLDAEVAAAPGTETIRASVARGVEVAAAGGAVLGRLAVFECGGSLDEVEALAVGDLGIGTPVIAVVATVGGRAEATTWLALLELGDHGLHRVFTGPIARRDHDDVTRGAISVDADARVVSYRPPGAARAARWTFEPAARAFAPAR